MLGVKGERYWLQLRREELGGCGGRQVKQRSTESLVPHIMDWFTCISLSSSPYVSDP